MLQFGGSQLVFTKLTTLKDSRQKNIIHRSPKPVLKLTDKAKSISNGI